MINNKDSFYSKTTDTVRILRQFTARKPPLLDLSPFSIHCYLNWDLCWW